MSMENKRAYSQGQFQSLELDTSAYSYNDDEGVFIATLDIKVWGNKMNLLAFFTFEDGRKVISSAPHFQKHFGLPDISVGRKLELTYAPSRKGNVYLTAVKELT